jgi:hypothetical protein
VKRKRESRVRKAPSDRYLLHIGLKISIRHTDKTVDRVTNTTATDTSSTL